MLPFDMGDYRSSLKQLRMRLTKSEGDCHYLGFQIFVDLAFDKQMTLLMELINADTALCEQSQYSCSLLQVRFVVVFLQFPTMLFWAVRIEHMLMHSLCSARMGSS